MQIYYKSSQIWNYGFEIISFKPKHELETDCYVLRCRLYAVVDIPFNDIEYIVLDANNKSTSKPAELKASDINTLDLVLER